MARTKKAQASENDTSREDNSTTKSVANIRFPKPKLLLIDMHDGCTEALAAGGYNVSVGSFGVPEEAERSSKVGLVCLKRARLPNFREQEIIFANLASRPANGAGPHETLAPGVDQIWQRLDEGEIDPRPLAMHHVRNDVDRILTHGGLVFLFLANRYGINYIIGQKPEYGSFQPSRELQLSNWQITTVLDDLKVRNASGDEIKLLQPRGMLQTLLRRVSEGATYSCTIEWQSYRDEQWLSIAEDKFGHCVAAVCKPKNATGCLVVLPQIPDFHEIILDVVDKWCTSVNPKLFPYNEGLAWLHSEDYELADVVELQRNIEAVREQSASRIAEMEKEIQRIQLENADWYRLLNGTGDALVGAVIRTLQRLGFSKVV
jgi:hypothetical protein